MWLLRMCPKQNIVYPKQANRNNQKQNHIKSEISLNPYSKPRLFITKLNIILKLFVENVHKLLSFPINFDV